MLANFFLGLVKYVQKKSIKMKNILFITSTVPNKNGSGLQQRCYRNLIALHEFSTVYVIFTGERDDTEEITANLVDLDLNNIYYLQPQNRIHQSWGASLLANVNQVFSASTNNIQFDKSALNSILTLLNFIISFDVFIFRLSNFNAYQFMIKNSKQQEQKLFIDWDDIESVALDRMNSIEKMTLGKVTYWKNKLLIWKLRRFERKVFHKSNNIFVCSRNDSKLMNSLYCTRKFESIPNSFDFNKERKQNTAENKKCVDIIFVGSMYYQPNQNGAIWFCEEVLPIIKANSNLRIKIWIIGYKPSERVQRLGELENVVVTGSVDSVAKYYEKSDFTISPIHFGGGTRIKILEASSYGKTTVTTTIGLEGIELIHMKEVLVADTPQLFAQHCIRLAEDSELRLSISKKAFDKCKILYDHSVVSQQLKDIILNCEDK
jgi:glycosyltransferase involved in cell wall biosynthesis